MKKINSRSFDAMLRRNSLKVIGIFLVLLLVLSYPVSIYLSEDTVNIQVTGFERIVESSGAGESQQVTSKYLVFTENEVFENTDSWLYLKFNSSDIYAKFKKGGIYTVKVVGWRIPFLSWYRNIISIKE